MDNYFDTITLDESCKFALDASNGGTLYSSFCDETLRNFYAYNQTWTDFQTIANTIGHDDFEFEITFKNNVNIPSTYTWLFYHNSQAGSINIAYNYELTSLFLGFNLYYDDGSGNYCGSVSKAAILASGVDIVSAGAIHTWKWSKSGTTVNVKINDINVLTATHSSYATCNLKSNTAPASQFNGNILSAKLTNKTSNVIMWQASNSQLYNTDAIFPSSTLRNFVTENASFNDFANMYNTIGTDDFEFEMQFNINPCVGKSVFYPSSSAKIGIMRGGAYTSYDFYITASKSLYLSNGNLFDTYTSVKIGDVTSDNISGVFKCKIQRIGATVKIFWNDIEIYTWSGATPASLPVINGANANFDGNIFYVTLKNLTLNKTIFYYPNFEEKTRLITKVNMLTDNGYFEGATKSGTIANTNIWNIKTAYNLMNQPLRSTYYCRANFSSMTDTATAMQWGFSTGNNLRAFYIQKASGLYSLTFSLVAKPTVQDFVQTNDQNLILQLLDRFVDYVIVVDDVARVISLYADCVFLASRPFSSTNLGFYQNTDYSIYLGSTVTGACRADLSKVEKFAYFNRVFTADEIKCISA